MNSNMSHTSTFASGGIGAPQWLTLRKVLGFDALTCVAMGLALTAFAQPLSGWLGLSPTLLLWAGLILFPSALAMVLAALRPVRVLVGLVVAGNVLWTVASLAVLVVAGSTVLGGAFVIVQAAAVAVLAWLESRLRA